VSYYYGSIWGGREGRGGGSITSVTTSTILKYGCMGVRVNQMHANYITNITN
jgi:hypothetical protein